MSQATARSSLVRRIRTRAERTFGAWGVFFKGFMKHPRMVGSIIPSSGTTVEKMLAPVDWAKCDLFVEYGPGVGTFCWPVLEKMKRDATLLVIDTNPDFVRYLRKSIPDSRFIAVHDSAENVREIIAAAGFDHADYILSGLPFSTLPDGIGERIAAETGKAIRPDGGFLVYQFVKAARTFMAPHFGRIDHGYSWWNILPCHLFWGWKE